MDTAEEAELRTKVSPPAHLRCIRARCWPTLGEIKA